MSNTGAYKVLTPAGAIFVETASEANNYKTTYGYPYVRTSEEKCNS